MRIAGFSKESIVDGLGYRYTIFVQGCKHACNGCHNPETWDMTAGTEYTDEMLDKLADEIASDPIIDGITLSGGDPFYQAEDCVKLINKVKSRNSDFDIWAYTGFTWEQLLKDSKMLELVKKCDVVVDGPFVLSCRSLEIPFRGSTNQRLIDVKKSLESGEVKTVNLDD